MQPADILFSRTDRFAVGLDLDSKEYYVSIPVHNGLVEYEEYYRIDKGVVDRLVLNLQEVKGIVQKSRERKNDSNLIVQPGSKRGSPV